MRLPCDPTGRPLPAGADRVRRVLDHGDAVAVAERVDRVEVDREAGEVDGHHSAGPRGDQRLRVAEVDQAGLGVGVHEHGARAGVLDDVGARHEGHAGDQDLVAGSDSQQPQGDRQPGGARGQAADVRGRARYPSSRSLERLDLRARGQPAAADGVEQLLDLLVADLRRAEAEVRAAEARGMRGRARSRVLTQCDAAAPRRARRHCECASLLRLSRPAAELPRRVLDEWGHARTHGRWMPTRWKRTSQGRTDSCGVRRH